MVLALTCISAAACDDGNSIAIEDLDEAIASASCKLALACGTLPDKQACPPASTSEAAQLRASVKAGKTRYDGAAAARCLDSLANLCSMDGGGQADPACDQAFKGTQPVGAACLSAVECMSGLCDTSECDGSVACCRGTCGSVVAIGGDCSASGAVCVTGAYCKTAPAPSVCAPIVAADEGQACAGGSCKAGLFCVDQVCTRLLAPGEACDPSQFDCNPFRGFCDSATNLCTAHRAVGQSCNGSNDCVEYAECTDVAGEGVCVARARLGEACLDKLCLVGFVCQEGVCALPAPEPVCP